MGIPRECLRRLCHWLAASERRRGSLSGIASDRAGCLEHGWGLLRLRVGREVKLESETSKRVLSSERPVLASAGIVGRGGELSLPHGI